MCGIVGYAGPERVERALLDAMAESLRHRGPDSAGALVADGVALAMRRLAVIDVHGGDQPISDESGAISVVFNGEIYNHRELRAQLQARGHRFATATDTECIVHLYEEHGVDCVEHLDGMFAFALWDARQRRLLLARDRTGEKPLYYRSTSDGVWFASELKALLQDRRHPVEVDPVALSHYLSFQYVPAPWAMVQGVQKLPPAHRLVFERGHARVERYWRLSFAPVDAQLDEADALDELDEHLDAAVAKRMVADRPLGAFLSGGIDSSLVVAAMAANSIRPVRTFTLGFDDLSFDERHWARVAARHLGTEHTEDVVSPSAIAVLPELVWHYDEPFADASAIPTFLVAAMARRHVTVVLSGDGGDEAFGGYERYRAAQYARWVPLPARARPAARALVGAVMPAASSSARVRRARRFTRGALAGREPGYFDWVAHFDEDAKARLCTDDLRAAMGHAGSLSLLRDAFTQSDAREPVQQLLDVDLGTYLPGDLLVKLDRASMAHSLEARTPFLDHHLLEFAATVPGQLKVRARPFGGPSGKYLLRRLAARKLPPELTCRRKQGFGVPIARWLRGELRELAHDVLTDARARDRGYFRPAEVARLLTEHERGADHSTRLWNLLQFELWHRTFVDARATSRAAVPPVGQLR
jgi:asparagine synthase (glutamine-hydrolysing)